MMNNMTVENNFDHIGAWSQEVFGYDDHQNISTSSKTGLWGIESNPDRVRPWIAAFMTASMALYPHGVEASATRSDFVKPSEQHPLGMQPTLVGYAPNSIHGNTFDSDVIEALEELRDLGYSVKVRNSVALIAGDWESSFNDEPIIEDLGDGSILLHLLPFDDIGGASLEILHDGRMVYNVMAGDGQSVGSGVLSAENTSTAVQTLLQTALQAGITFQS